MSEEGPKLFTNKPKKAQLLKHLKEELKKTQDGSSTTTNSASSSASSASSAAASYKMGPPPPSPPPPQPPKVPFVRRYKFLWPMLLAVNLGVGAYLFVRTKKKDTGEEAAPSNVPSAPVSTSAPSETSTPLPSVPAPAPAKLREPIPENEQRQLFKWMLEEKRKVKPKDAEEKKRLDEEKAILKQFIRAKSIPNI